MEKYLSIYLTASSDRSLISTKDVVGVTMKTTSSIKIWYKGGRTVLLSLSTHMASNNNTACNYVAKYIANTQKVGQPDTSGYSEVISKLPSPLEGIIPSGDGSVYVASITIE